MAAENKNTESSNETNTKHTPKHFADDVAESNNKSKNDKKEEKKGNQQKADEKNASDKSDVKEQKSSKGKTIAIIIIVILAIICIAAGGYMMWKSQQPVTDPGATIQSYDGKSDKDIQEELNRQAEQSRMTISVAPKVQLKDGKARVNVVNTKGNKFNQTFTLTQNGKQIYKSGIIKVGEKVEWCNANGLKEGVNATLTVQAVDKKSGKPSGNPQSVDVEVVKGSESSK